MSAKKPGDTVTNRFFTRDPSTGSLTDADSLPTGAIYREGTLDATATVTVTKVASTTGIYTYSYTLPADWSAGNLVRLEISATVAGESDIAGLDQFTLSEIEPGTTFTVDDTTVTPTPTQFALDASAPDGDDELVGQLVMFTSGTLKGVTPKTVATYTGATRLATFDTAWPSAPAAADRGLAIGKSN